MDVEKQCLRSKSFQGWNESIHFRNKENDMKMTAKALRLFRQWRACRRTEMELHRLNDMELKDLGISRHDIPGIARSSAYEA